MLPGLDLSPWLRYIMAAAAFVLAVVDEALATDCQSQCACGLPLDAPPTEDATVRYEVMSGLVGAFSPLLVGGIGFMAFKLCSKPSLPSMPSNPFSWNNSGKHDFGNGKLDGGKPTGGNPAINHDPDPKRGSTPFSLYGENDDEFLSEHTDSPMPGREAGPRGGGRPDTAMSGLTSVSRNTNIHRSVKSDLVNQWFKNVAR